MITEIKKIYGDSYHVTEDGVRIGRALGDNKSPSMAQLLIDHADVVVSNIAAEPSAAPVNWDNTNLVKTTNPLDKTSGSMLKVGDFGVGGTIDLGATDFKVIRNGIFQISESGSTNAPFSSPSGFEAFICEYKFTGTNFGTLTATTARYGVSQDRTFRASYSVTEGGWSGWQEVWTEGNLNKNVWSATGVNQIMASDIGYANSTTSAVFLLNMIEPTTPTVLATTSTISVFTLASVNKGTVSGGDVAMNSSSTARCAAVVITGLSGLTINELVTMRSGTSTSKIEIT